MDPTWRSIWARCCGADLPLSLALLIGTSACTSGMPTLTLSLVSPATPASPGRIRAVATAANGTSGTGVIRFSAELGTVDPESVALDEYGTARATWSCGATPAECPDGGVKLQARWSSEAAVVAQTLRMPIELDHSASEAGGADGGNGGLGSFSADTAHVVVGYHDSSCPISGHGAVVPVKNPSQVAFGFYCWQPNSNYMSVARGRLYYLDGCAVREFVRDPLTRSSTGVYSLPMNGGDNDPVTGLDGCTGRAERFMAWPDRDGFVYVQDNRAKVSPGGQLLWDGQAPLALGANGFVLYRLMLRTSDGTSISLSGPATLPFGIDRAVWAGDVFLVLAELSAGGSRALYAVGQDGSVNVRGMYAATIPNSVTNTVPGLLPSGDMYQGFLATPASSGTTLYRFAPDGSPPTLELRLAGDMWTSYLGLGTPDYLETLIVPSAGR